MKPPNIHFSTYSSNVVKTICLPLFKETAICYFHYEKLYDDGRVSILTTHPEVIKHFWDKKYDQMVFPNYRPGIFFKEECLKRREEDARKLFNLDHLLILIYRKAKYFETFGFATQANNDQVFSFYLNHFEILRQFSSYFKYMAKELIVEADSYLISSDNYRVNSLSAETSTVKYAELSTKISAIELEIELGKFRIILTEKETQILKLLAKGKTAKEIAQQLNRTQKTIETHLMHIRNKLHCHSRSKLINIYRGFYKFA